MTQRKNASGKAALGWIVSLLTVVVSLSGVGCSPQQRIKEWQRDFKKEMQRQAAAPKTPEERCQRQKGVLYQEQCYTPSAAAVDERSCRLRGGLHIDGQCLLSPQEKPALPTAPTATSSIQP